MRFALIQMPVAQHRDRFRIGIGFGLDLMLGQFLADLFEVLDDAVVYNRHPTALVWVRVVGVRSAVGCPTRVTNTSRASERFMHQKVVKVDQLAHRTATVQMPVADRRDPGAVVAAIFKLLEPFNEDGGSLV